MIRVLDDSGNAIEEALAVCHGKTPEDWEQASDDKSFVEFIDGRLIMHSPISLTHARLFGFVHFLLVGFVQDRELGEVLTGPFAMDLSADRKFEPDLLFVTKESARNLGEDRLHGPADLAIEIASPSTRTYDRGEKRECYRVGGVREYWMIDPYEKMVTLDRPAGHEISRAARGPVQSETCPGFQLHAEWLWESPLPNVQTCLSRVLGGGEGKERE